MMLAPLIHAIPLRTAGAGRASWLITFPVVIPLGVLFYFLFRCLERMPEGSGMGDLYLLALGQRWGSSAASSAPSGLSLCSSRTCVFTPSAM